MVITGDEMAKIDKYAIEVLEIPALLLMENAALALLDHIDLVNDIKYTIVCGTGNNGADGLALARHLLNYDHHVDIIIVGEINKYNKEYMTYYNILRNLGLEPMNLKEDSQLEDLDLAGARLRNSDLIVDAIFGTGLDSPISGVYEYVIDMINSSDVEVLSVDIASGINANDGRVMGIAVDADTIVCFEFMKEGLDKNSSILGKIFVEPISIPRKAVNEALK